MIEDRLTGEFRIKNWFKKTPGFLPHASPRLRRAQAPACRDKKRLKVVSLSLLKFPQMQIKAFGGSSIIYPPHK